MMHLTYVLCMSVAASSLAVPLDAQCSSWSPAFPPVNAPNNRVYDMHVHDDGSGLALYVCGKFSSAGSSGNAYIARYRNGAWTGLDPGHIQKLFERYGTYAQAVASFIKDAADESLKSVSVYTRREIIFLVQHEKI